jgi:molybdate transport system substrate-binding protein
VGLSFCLAILLTMACHQDPTPKSPILVAAAASLQASLQEITAQYAIIHPQRRVNYNFAASGALQQQIERGAPVDVFISAANAQMNALQAQGLLLTGTRTNLLTNQLVLIAPKGSPLAITSFSQLVQPAVRRIAIGETRTVPAGQYAAQMLTKLGIFDRLKSKFVLGNNVRSVLTAVETGNADAGIVYFTDAQSSGQISIVATADPTLHDPITYPIAILKSSQDPDRSQQYLEFLKTNSATAIFKKYGFGIASE